MDGAMSEFFEATEQLDRSPGLMTFIIKLGASSDISMLRLSGDYILLGV